MKGLAGPAGGPTQPQPRPVTPTAPRIWCKQCCYRPTDGGRGIAAVEHGDLRQRHTPRLLHSPYVGSSLHDDRPAPRVPQHRYCDRQDEFGLTFVPGEVNTAPGRHPRAAAQHLSNPGGYMLGPTQEGRPVELVPPAPSGLSEPALPSSGSGSSAWCQRRHHQVLGRRGNSSTTMNSGG